MPSRHPRLFIVPHGASLYGGFPALEYIPSPAASDARHYGLALMCAVAGAADRRQKEVHSMYDYKINHIRKLKDAAHECYQWRDTAHRMADTISRMTAGEDGIPVLSIQTILSIYKAPQQHDGTEAGALMMSAWMSRAPHTRAQWQRFAEMMEEKYSHEGWNAAIVLSFMGKGGGL